MEKKPPKLMTPFDELVSLPELQTIKLFFPYLPSDRQPFLAVFIKFLELQHTIACFQSGNVSASPLFRQTLGSPAEILEDLIPYMSPQEAEMLQTVQMMMQMMEMSETFQETAGDSPDDGFNPMDLMMGMLSPEQQEMFQMYQTMFSSDENASGSHEKGGTDSE